MPALQHAPPRRARAQNGPPGPRQNPKISGRVPICFGTGCPPRPSSATRKLSTATSTVSVASEALRRSIVAPDTSRSTTVGEDPLTADVDEQRADPLLRPARQVPDDRQRDLATIRAIPVQRHVYLRTLQPLAAIDPCEPRSGKIGWIVPAA